MDLGACPKSHTDRLKQEFDAAREKDPNDPRFSRFREEYERNIFSFVDECDRRIRSAHRRLEKTPEENAATPSAIVSKAGKGETHVSLVEIGPRFVLTPIVILEGSFGGPVIFENKEFVSPNQIRSDLRKAKSGRYNKRADQQIERKAKRRDMGLRTGEGVREVDELDDTVLFK